MPFKKGESGNPGGRKRVDKSIIELAKKEAPAAFKRIIEVSKGSGDARLKFQANCYICDRAWGKPVQATELSGVGGEPLQVTVNVVSKTAKVTQEKAAPKKKTKKKATK